MPTTKRLLIPLAAALIVCAFAAPSALASTKQVTMVLDNAALNSNPAGTLAKLKTMGVTMVKYSVSWSYFAPNAASTAAPSAATSAGAYETYDQFGQIDAMDIDAAKLGIKVGLLVTAPAPRWAEGTAGCTSIQITGYGSCRPNPAEFETFVEALGARYSGAFKVNGVTLPAVKWWSLWNEPNYIPNIAPQTTGSATYVAAGIYRTLLDAGYAGLKATGHGGDTLLFGDLAPRGIASTKAGNAAGIKPVQFLASLYCVTTAGKRLTGAAASAIGCPSSAAAFKSANPALFSASGIADHPYAQGTEPDVPTYDCGSLACQNKTTKKGDPLWTDLGQISNLENGLSKDLKAYGSAKKFAIWNTEYGYWATPSSKACHSATEADCAINPTEAAYYDNWAEYLSYKNSRIASFAQYQLYEPANASSGGNWSDGLLNASGTERPAAYAAFVMPLFMPTTSASKAGSLTVWGGVRPAAVYKLAYNIAPKVAIQFKAKSGGWKTLKTVAVNLITGYFDTTASFGQSGSVRLAYSSGKTALYSRTQTITVK